MAGQVGNEAAEPLALGARRAGVDVGGGVAGTELAHPDRRDPPRVEVAPIPGPRRGQARGGRGGAEPGLREEAGPIVVSRVDDVPGRAQRDRVPASQGQVAAPPGRVVRPGRTRVLADPLAEDQRARVGGQDRVAGLLVAEPDVGGRIPGTPRRALGVAVPGRSVRLVTQVEADDRRVARVPAGQHGPVPDPVLAGVGGGVPETVLLGRLAGFGPVVVQDDLQPVLPGVRDDLVQDLQRVEVLEVRVDRARGAVGADALRHDRVLHHLVRERDANRVVAELPGVIDDRPVVLRPEAVRHFVGGLEAIPVDPRDPDGTAAGVQDLLAARVPVPGPEPGGADRAGTGSGGADRAGPGIGGDQGRSGGQGTPQNDDGSGQA